MLFHWHFRYCAVFYHCINGNSPLRRCSNYSGKVQEHVEGCVDSFNWIENINQIQLLKFPSLNQKNIRIRFHAFQQILIPYSRFHAFPFHVFGRGYWSHNHDRREFVTRIFGLIRPRLSGTFKIFDFHKMRLPNTTVSKMIWDLLGFVKVSGCLQNQE